MTVSSTGFELAAKGYFGQKRGRYGYQLSMAFLGGSIGEVLDEYLDSDTTTAAARLDDLFGSLDTFRRRIGIKATEVLLRGDAQYGTPDILRKIEVFGFRYLFKGFSPQRARRLFTRVPSEAIFHAVPNGAARELAWVCEMGQIEHVPGSSQQRCLAVRARTLLMERTFWMYPKRRPGPRTRAKRPRAEDGLVAQHRFDYFLTNLTPTQMPLDHLLEVYHGRSTIERYFYDEQYGLGARQVRTHSLAGESIFEFLVATTNNLLRWMRETVFKDTPIEHLGLQRLVHWVMQIPARIRRVGARLIVQLPSRHEIIRLLIASPGAVLTTIGDT